MRGSFIRIHISIIAIVIIRWILSAAKSNLRNTGEWIPWIIIVLWNTAYPHDQYTGSACTCAFSTGQFASVVFSLQPRKAPPLVYYRGLAAGLLVGFGMETMLIKSGYYNIILKAEAKSLLKAQAQQDQEQQEQLSVEAK
ncbi:hypothetical protein BDR26DRAFT_894317 [Obelidium mucronatum]|nr:hypothetical protein BDR26DRAFT_894317 [Obelidium mucronatum]